MKLTKKEKVFLILIPLLMSVTLIIKHYAVLSDSAYDFFLGACLGLALVFVITLFRKRRGISR